MASSSSASNFLKQGYVPFSGNSAEYHGWVSLFRSIMYDVGLGRVMSGSETAPEAPRESSPEAARQFAKEKQDFVEKNGKLYTRLLLATSAGSDGFASAASLVVQTFGPIGTAEFGDGRKAFLALEQKYRLEGSHRMGQLQEQLGSLAVTSADAYDPARAIQEMRRICAELDALGDKVVQARKVHTFLKALPDKHYAHFKAVLAAERRDDGDEMDFDDLARRATSFHALQIRGKIDTNDDDSGSQGRALNTVVHGGAREFRKQGGRGRNRRGNGGRNANGNNSSSNGNNSSGGTNSNQNSPGESSAGSAQGARGGGRGNQNSGGGRGRGQRNGQNRKGRCRYCHNSTEHGWDNCPLRLSHEAKDSEEDADEQANISRESTTQAWFTQVHGGLEDFEIVFYECPQALGVPAATQAEKRVAGYTQVQKFLLQRSPRSALLDIRRC